MILKYLFMRTVSYVTQAYYGAKLLRSSVSSVLGSSACQSVIHALSRHN